MSKVNISKSFMVVLAVMAVGFGTVLGLWSTFNFTDNLSAPPSRPSTFITDSGSFDIANIPDVLDVTVELTGVGAIGHTITATVTVTLTDTSQTLSSWNANLYIDKANLNNVETLPHTGSTLNAGNPSETWTETFVLENTETHHTRVGFWGMTWS